VDRNNTSAQLFKKAFFANLLLAVTAPLWAIPVDWHGALSVDTTNILNYRKTVQSTNSTSPIDPGSQEIYITNGAGDNASFQNYIFRLEPNIVINDAASVFAEITNGYARGGRFGDNSTSSRESGMGSALYAFNTSDTGVASLAFAKFYMELYSDVGTYQIGRHSAGWALGAVVSDGKGANDHFSSTRDGISVSYKLGNFTLAPYWAKLGSIGSQTRTHKVEEHGISMLYDNTERAYGFGVLYSKKDSGTQNQLIQTDVGGMGATSVGIVDTKLFDLYFKKRFGNFSFEVEIPFFSGKIGNIYQDGRNINYKARSVIFESKYFINDFWTVGFNAGTISGEDGQISNYGATYLNPNYQIAYLMFRYNLMAISDDNKSLYDSYITNANYLRFYGKYLSGKWLWNMAFIYAAANEIASTGHDAYNHLTNKQFAATANQNSELGFEVDGGFDYQWNKEISVSGILGYHFAGDYYAFTNSDNPNDASDSYIYQFKTTISF